MMDMCNGWSVAQRVLIYFALAPDEMLYRGDLPLKFGGNAKDICRSIEHLVKDGKLAKAQMPVDGQRKPTTVYSAGPRLLELVAGMIRSHGI